MRDQPPSPNSMRPTGAESISAPVSSVTRPPKAKKSLGQNFLVDRRIRTKIVDAAELSPTDTVLEVGPGRGFLTKALAEQAGHVLALELDSSLIPHLTERLIECPNVEIVEDDARSVKINDLVETETDYKLVANLPFYAATHIVRRFLETPRKPTILVVMVQKEVALEMTASPGKMGILSVATQVYGSPRIITSVPPKAFRPSPSVTSAVVRIDTYAKPAVPFDSAEEFFALVRAAFSAPRKQIHNSLKNGLNTAPDKINMLLRNAGISPARRPQTLNIEEWKTLYLQHMSTLHTGDDIPTPSP